jgi:hypothetical protein
MIMTILRTILKHLHRYLAEVEFRYDNDLMNSKRPLASLKRARTRFTAKAANQVGKQVRRSMGTEGLLSWLLAFFLVVLRPDHRLRVLQGC